ncbi:solute carrier family 12 member 9 isoform X2 [Octopus bimaculoides]|uniref:Solute carrier family 12 member 9 n=1 Tax=Octopus bimaculoides TaxID=37653 RepID=A0A0L8FHE4_OCTBM|nr:solute carrier family 12 member 9 isoform X2 [Octopus bimaculoides]|eukprot:XP_014789783.1 PREDICTED: solute carrier family 12 member 9-like isoform X1 [Octopus bimaculoides]
MAESDNTKATEFSGYATSGELDTDSFRDDHRIVYSESTPILRSQWVWRLHRSLSNASLEYSSTYPPSYDCISNPLSQQRNHDGRRNSSSMRTLGTFAGVFCPVSLSMFSTFLFLRAGFAIGQAGILVILSQFVIAYVILLLTVLSICAISTNGLVEGGGAYYMISRALGPEFGGSIGFLFFVANVFSCSLYTSAIVEGLIQNFGPSGTFTSNSTVYLPYDETNHWYDYMYATICLFLCLAICFVGGAMFARFSAFILLIVSLCTLMTIISFLVKKDIIPVPIPRSNTLVYKMSNYSDVFGNYTGLKFSTFKQNLYENYTTDYSTDTKMTFGIVFSILFSSITGIMNGANMSGELKDPSRSIPNGTLAAMAYTFITYIILSFLIAASCDRFLLVNDYVFLQDINIWKPFVVIGIFAVTFSSALGNLIGGSRVLERLANDHLFWFVLSPATITSRNGNPFVAVLITWLFAQLVLLIGSLNAIAPFTSVCFLLSYASTNLACLGLEVASAPNFRPTFKYFSWHTSLLGLIGCIIMSFYVSPLYASISVIVLLLLVILLHIRSLPSSWGSISQALIFHQVRKYLLMLDTRKDHVKYWRPQILLMVAHPCQSCELMDFINDLKKGGLYIIGHVKIGTLNKHLSDPIQDDYSKWLSLIDYLKIKAFPEVTMASSVSEGLIHLARISGLGGMKPNTVCFGFYDDATPVDSFMKTRIRHGTVVNSVEDGSSENISERFGAVRSDKDPHSVQSSEEFVGFIRDCLKMQKNVCICRHFNQLDKNSILSSKSEHFIDVWPLNFFQPETSNYFDVTCLYMLQLACILHMVPKWKKHTTLRVFLCVDTVNDNTLQKEKKLDDFLRQLRILARIKIVPWDQILTYYRANEDQHESSEEMMQKFYSLGDSTLKMINQLIVDHSRATAISFIYLPLAPSDISKYEKYLHQLTVLSNSLPPTMFVHGLHPVTSTTL